MHLQQRKHNYEQKHQRTRSVDGTRSKPSPSVQFHLDRNVPLRHFLQQAHKGHGVLGAKSHSFGHRLYRHGIRPKGFHDYQNLQFDPSIYRGRTFRDFREKNLPPFTPTLNLKKLCCADCSRGRREQGGAQGKAVKRIQLPRLTIGGIIRPTTDDIVGEQASNHSRRKMEMSQKEMEPFIIEDVIIREYKEMETQADETKACAPMYCTRIASGMSVATQANISVEGTDEDHIIPIISTVASKVLECSLLECMEDYEIRQIRADIYRLMERRRKRQIKEMRVVQNEVWRHEITEEQRLTVLQQFAMEVEAERAVGAMAFVCMFCRQVRDDVFEQLRRDHVLHSDNEIIEEHFNSWLHEKVEHSMELLPRRILDDIIQNVEDIRTTEAHFGPVDTDEIEDAVPNQLFPDRFQIPTVRVHPPLEEAGEAGWDSSYRFQETTAPYTTETDYTTDTDADEGGVDTSFSDASATH